MSGDFRSRGWWAALLELAALLLRSVGRIPDAIVELARAEHVTTGRLAVAGLLLLAFVGLLGLLGLAVTAVVV